MPWKENEDKSLFRDDKGNPVWINEAGEEKPVDYTAMTASMAKANKEAAERRKALDDAKAELAKWEGIEDPDAARKALEAVASMPDNQKALEEQIQARLKPLQEGFAAKMAAKERALEDLTKTVAEKDGLLEKETVKHAFFQSPYVRDRLSSGTLAASLFSSRFALKDGVLVGLSESGDPIYGDDGTPASFEASLAKMVEASPDRALLIKGNDKNGSGAPPYNPAGGSKNPLDARGNIEAGIRAGLLK